MTSFVTALTSLPTLSGTVCVYSLVFCAPSQKNLIR
jgi:hypothetical protein